MSGTTNQALRPKFCVQRNKSAMMMCNRWMREEVRGQRTSGLNVRSHGPISMPMQKLMSSFLTMVSRTSFSLTVQVT